MSKPRLAYFEKEDVLRLVAKEGPEAQSVELSPNVTAELNDKGELIGIEILNASSFLRDTIMESAQAKLLAVGSNGSESQSEQKALRYNAPGTKDEVPGINGLL